MESSTWLLFIYQLPASPSTHRAYVWRKLKLLGALYLQNSICLLPQTETIEGKLDELRLEIESRGGESGLLHIELSEVHEQEKVLARFEQQMNDEYGEFLEQCNDFHAELEKERGKQHFTFGELEENDAELNKLRSWMPKLLGRDYFQAAMRQHAIDALRSCEDDFEVFEREVEAASSSAG